MQHRFFPATHLIKQAACPIQPQIVQMHRVKSVLQSVRARSSRKQITSDYLGSAHLAQRLQGTELTKEAGKSFSYFETPGSGTVWAPLWLSVCLYAYHRYIYIYIHTHACVCVCVCVYGCGTPS